MYRLTSLRGWKLFQCKQGQVYIECAVNKYSFSFFTHLSPFNA